MTRTHTAALMLAVVVGTAGCGGNGAPAAPTQMSPAPDPAPDVVSHVGLGPIRFGDTREKLERDHGLIDEPDSCGPRLPAYPTTSPVLDGDRLVLLWADPPLRTPDGLAVGTPVDDVRQTHPEAEELLAPPETFRFDGLLVPVEDRAYLFLHDQGTVQKLIVGYEQHARAVFEDGFGTC